MDKRTLRDVLKSFGVYGNVDYHAFEMFIADEAFVPAVVKMLVFCERNAPYIKLLAKANIDEATHLLLQYPAGVTDYHDLSQPVAIDEDGDIILKNGTHMAVFKYERLVAAR